ncbi:hypothetical protein Q9L58_001471 [Maublancomyces gigas]|uniref:Uncharacterized protein n=1 Tax=Discina gigas TaxID=1032678 RepID=A0ABR3GUD0_9PEZI
MSDPPPQQSVSSDEPTNASRGHGDYVQISIDNRTGIELGISHAALSSGKFHVVGNKSSILTPASVNTITIPNGTTGDVCSCGHNSASVGTEGSFWITAHNDVTLVTKVVWDCPYSGSNSFNASEGTPIIKVTQRGGTNTSGALGLVYLTLGPH